MALGKYILVTPVKNEGKNIAKVLESVINQTILPEIWVIVDDNSTDDTFKILRVYEKKYLFIKVIRYPEKKEYDVGIHYSEVCKYGFDFAIHYCKNNEISYDYIALLDGDIIIDNKYFEELMIAFKGDPTLGILSGYTYSWDGEKYMKDGVNNPLPSGAARMWRRECFEITGGYMITYSPDTVSNIKALMRGCNIKKVGGLRVKQVRKTGEGEGLKRSYMKRGIAHYYLYHKPLLIALRFIKYFIKDGGVLAIFYIKGYIYAKKKKMPRIEDEDIKKYFKEMNLIKYIKMWSDANEKI